jgi:hypothetical protein
MENRVWSLPIILWKGRAEQGCTEVRRAQETCYICLPTLDSCCGEHQERAGHAGDSVHGCVELESEVHRDASIELVHVIQEHVLKHQRPLLVLHHKVVGALHTQKSTCDSQSALP